MKLHEKIYYCRKKAGLSQDALSERLGISRQAVSKWETGESVPETGKLAALAAALGVSVDWLLSEDEPEEDSGNSEQDAYGCFTGSRESYDSSRSRNQDWVDTLPRYIQKIARRWGWLAGVYIAVSGLPITIIGALATIISNRMLSGFHSSMGGMFGTTIEIDGNIIPIEDGAFSGFAQSNPVAMLGTAIMVIGIVLIVVGIALAIFLKRKSKG